jgi:hypothetical protein
MKENKCVIASRQSERFPNPIYLDVDFITTMISIGLGLKALPLVDMRPNPTPIIHLYQNSF